MTQKHLRKIFADSGKMLWQRSPSLIGMILLTVILSVALVQADDPNRVGLIVVHGDDEVITQCIEFAEDEITGLELLERSGLDINIEASGGMGAAVCRIDGEGCTYPEEQCWCQCQGQPCIFWSYWRLQEGRWEFSELGASNNKVKDGDLQGWVWGEGSPSGGGSPPPDIPYGEICELSATATPTPTHTTQPTSTPTETLQPTDTPEPTDTSTPEPTPVIHHFSADRATIKAGESVQLSWDLSGAEAAFLRYNGSEEGVISPGNKTIRPDQTTIYTLVARNDSGEAINELTITVSGSAPAPTSTPTPVPVAASNEAGRAEVAPTQTSAPEPAINFSAAAARLPAGACTTLRWDVQRARQVLLDGAEVNSQGATEVCPAQTQTYRLRVLYPGGERTAQLTLKVFDPVGVPTETVSPTATSSLASLPTLPASATPQSVALAPTSADLSPASPGQERIAEPIRGSETSSNGTNRLDQLLSYGVIVIILLLFLILPITLLAIGWIAWWLRRSRQP